MTDPRTFGLTPRAKRLLDFLRERSAISEVSPSYREIAEALGFSSVATAHDVVVALEKRGFIRRIPNSSRSIELVEPLAFVLPREIARRVRADAAIRGRSPEEHVADAILAFSPSNATAQPRRGWRSSPGF